MPAERYEEEYGLLVRDLTLITTHMLQSRDR
jgi:hypothetical protein